MRRFQIGIALNSAIIIANTITGFLIPWVVFNYDAKTGYWPIPIPVELGLVKCFGDTCKLRKLAKGIPPAPYGAPSGSTPPQWGPPPASGTASGYGVPPAAAAGGGGGTDSLGGIPGPSSPAFPFVVASVTAVVLISLSCLLALAAISLEAGRVRGKYDSSSRNPLTFTLWSSASAVLAPLLYMAVTAAALNGGEYRVGVWVALGCGGGSAFMSFVTWIMDDDEYQPIPAVAARPLAPGPKGVVTRV